MASLGLTAASGPRWMCYARHGALVGLGQEVGKGSCLREGVEETPDVAHRVFMVGPPLESPHHPLALGTHWSQVGDKAGMVGDVVEDRAEEVGLDSVEGGAVEGI